MSRDQATEVRVASAGGVDVGEVTTRYLLYGLLPSWFVPGLADWMMHRRTRIEGTAGTKESVILPHCSKSVGGAPTLMMAEVGIPIAAALRYEVNPALLAVRLGGAAVHEATALWDVRTAVDSGREVRPIEQNIHSFLESLPFGALASLMCLHSDQVRSLLRGGRGDPDAWRLVPRRRPLSRACLAGVAAAIGTCVLLPYGEELLRCRRAARRNKKRATSDEARWRATKGR
ncbi:MULTISPECIES: diguanylate cyclase [unclassified Streptomyces]|uniref:diguanylate cyclase n=1 Tax=unclassified Streptomyces TaxID=2593676 RepID=UPI0022523A8D|nr:MULTISPECIES: diguanylate cyclase [unclassified Streptomyces]MCX5330243.1 diguanylate cyclase [Streptomyces sp. NBC_00140]MCX5359643.1 diguanylate cyclase [Streptomyces sp. NBC_00124]